MSTRPPAFRRAIVYAVLCGAIAAALALRSGLGDAVVTILIFGGVNLIFYLSWRGWTGRSVPFNFEYFWLAIALVGSGVFFAVAVIESGMAQAMITLAPIPAVILIWIILRRVLGPRSR